MPDTARVSGGTDGTEPLLFPDSGPLAYLRLRDGEEVFFGGLKKGAALLQLTKNLLLHFFGS